MPSTSRPHRISGVPRLGAALVAVLAALPAIQACVAAPPERRTPERRQPIIVERPQPSMQRLIVQYGEGNPRAQERRILAALQGVPHTVVNSLPGGRTLILETDRQGLARLQALPGVVVHVDGVDAPTN